jgi:hypothetical protein
MRFRSVTLPLTALTLFLAGTFAGSNHKAPAPEDQEKPHWLTDYDQARKLTHASGKPIFVVFRCEH